MIAEINFFGVYISSALFSAVIALLLHLLLRHLLHRTSFYRYVFHHNLVDMALFMIVWGGVAWLVMSFSYPLFSLFG